MADTTFVSKVTVIPNAWLQDLNNAYYRGQTFPAPGVTTPSVQSAAGNNLRLNAGSGGNVLIQLNGSTAYLFDATQLNPQQGDNVQNLGAPSLRWAKLFTPIVDSGTAGTLSFKLNNGETGFQVVRNGVAVNNFTVEGGSAGTSVAMRTVGADTDISVLYTTKGAGVFQFNTGGGAQFQILHVASANRIITVIGSNSGNPTLGVTGGSLAITPAIVATAGQIQFPAVQNPSADLNTLDDYEEGSWTPGLSFGGATTGWVFSASGDYTKTGKNVTAYYTVSVNTKGSAVGNCLLTTLPFNTSTDTVSLAMGGALSEWISMLTNFVFISARVDSTAGGTTAKLFGAAGAAGSLTQLTDAAFQVGSVIRGTFTYQATA